MPPLLLYAIWTIAALLAAAAIFHILARLGALGQSICDLCSRAPLLDAVVFFFTHGPWVACCIVWCRTTDHSLAALAAYFGTTIAAQVVTLTLWSWAHELMHPKARKGPRIVHTLNRRVGWFRNHAAVWWTALAVPLFTIVRIGELVIYPPLTWLVRLPKYRTREWVNVSRQKFDGLVGWDLIWCLYCDWMTGVWSLGSEMLRNVESFWCPIRFNSPEKCENCKTDFPDVASDWIPPPPIGDMEKVTALLERKYPGPHNVNSWYSHPTRLTIEGKQPK